jgi:glutamate-ammonia-ligase adenylyltransferase
VTAKHGRPQGIEGTDTGFAVVGYGKLGGIELGYGSDLDLVFLHGNRDANAMTDGKRPLPNDVFYARLGQRLVFILTTRTPSGIVYEVDMRLRPNGNAGMLVTSLPTFEHYQEHDAWTWEHQALIRARFVAGDPAIAARFEAVRRHVLSRPRDEETVRTDVREMREKMRATLDKSSETDFDLKQGRGGITDIEFMVQFCVLRWAHRYPELLEWTDNIRLLETLARLDLLEGHAADQLANMYRVFRAAYHRDALRERPGLISSADMVEERRMVREMWQEMFGEPEAEGRAAD